MSREKQIEEMSKAIDQSGMLDNYSRCQIVAGELYNAGYRKSSDLAEEIFAEIETSFIVSGCHDGSFFYEIRVEDYKHYKKKYIGKDTNVTTNTEEGK